MNRRGNKIRTALFLVLLSAMSCSTPKTETPENTSEQTAGSAKKENQAYSGECQVLYAEAGKMDAILLQQTEVDNIAANQAIKAFTEFAYHCKSDSMSPVYLVKTAQVARAINNIPQAKVALEFCIDSFPTFNNRPAAIFLLAQLYDEVNYLNNEDKAKELYQKILDEYPKSDWAASAKGAIGFLGMTDEQIMKQLKSGKK